MHPPKQFNFIQTTCTTEVRLPLVMGLPLLPPASESIAQPSTQQCEQAQETDQKAFRRGAGAHGNNLTYLIFLKISGLRTLHHHGRENNRHNGCNQIRQADFTVSHGITSSDYIFYYFVIFWFITRPAQDRQAIAQKVYYAIHQTAGNLCRHNPNRTAP